MCYHAADVGQAVLITDLAAVILIIETCVVGVNDWQQYHQHAMYEVQKIHAVVDDWPELISDCEMEKSIVVACEHQLLTLFFDPLLL